MALVPLVVVAMNLVYSVSAYPFGKLADSMSCARLPAIGLVVLIASDIVLAYGSHWPVVILGVVLWGLHMGLTQGLLATMVALRLTRSPQHHRSRSRNGTNAMHVYLRRAWANFINDCCAWR